MSKFTLQRVYKILMKYKKQRRNKVVTFVTSVFTSTTGVLFIFLLIILRGFEVYRLHGEEVRK